MSFLDHLPESARAFGRTVPDELHHYTSASAIIPIVTNAELWAGLPEQMNDRFEVLQAFRWLRVIAKGRELDDAVDPSERMFAKHVAKRSQGDRLTHTLEQHRFFVVSLSELPDSLPQWRAYTPRSGGYCLNLPGPLVTAAADAGGWTLAPVVYDEKTAETIITEVFQHYLDQYVDRVVRPGEDPTRTPAELEAEASTTSVLISQVIDHVRHLAPFIKDPRFAPEQEWRLLMARKPEHADLRFVPAEHGVRAFLPFEFLAGHPRAFPDRPRPSLTRGPTAQPEGSKYVGEALLEGLVGAGNADLWEHSSGYR